MELIYLIVKYCMMGFPMNPLNLIIHPNTYTQDWSEISAEMEMVIWFLLEIQEYMLPTGKDQGKSILLSLLK